MKTLSHRLLTNERARRLAKRTLERWYYGSICRARSLASKLLYRSGRNELKFAPIFFTLIQIDLPNRKSPKFLVDISKISRRIDIGRLHGSNVRIASTLLEMNRGNLLIPGPWPDGTTAPIDEPFESPSFGSFAPETIRLMFTEGVAWSDTPEFQHLRVLIERGKNKSVHSRVRELETRGENLQRLFDDISNGRYKMSHEIYRPYWDEAHFYIDEFGNFCGPGQHGNHRFEIARTLQLERIPMIFGGISISHYRGIFDELYGARSKVFSLLEDELFMVPSG